MTTLHTQNGAQGANAPYFPGALTDSQAARFNGDSEFNRIVYGTYWHAAAFGLNIDAEIAKLVGEIRQTVDQMEVLETTVQTAKARLHTMLTLKGESWSDADGYARLMKNSVRTSYDTHALDQKILKNPRKFAWLKRFRKQFTVRGGVQVR